MAKKKIEENTKNSVINKNELLSLIKIVAIVSIVLLVFYFITVLVDKKLTKDSYKSNDSAAVIQYEKIMIGEILNRKEGSYYVLVEKEDDSYVTLYKQYLSSGNIIKYYTVDLDDVFNKASVSDKTKVEGNDPSQYKFSSTALLKIDNNKLAAVYYDQESITNYLDTLIK